MAIGAAFTKAGLNSFLNRELKSSPDYGYFYLFKIGTGTNTPSESDTDLQTPITAWYSGSDFKPVDPFTFTEASKTFSALCIVTDAEANSGSPTISEFGIFNLAGTMLFRAVITGIPKSTSRQIEETFNGIITQQL